MYLRFRNDRRSVASKGPERLGSDRLAGPCPCGVGTLGLGDGGFLGALSSSGNLTPDYIKWAQRSLNRLRGRRMLVDGKVSKQYTDEVEAFQKATKLGVDGKVGRTTANRLIKDNHADKAYARWIQHALIKQGACLVPTGTLNVASQRAIEQFQKCHKLSSDGWVGFETEARLIREGGGLPPGHIAPDHGRTWSLPDRLKNDNQREWIEKHWLPYPEFRQRLCNKQLPKTIVLSCSDSRVTPEYIFNSQIGDMFTIRTAGQVLDDAVRGTLQFAADNEATETIIVLGHEDCGAVKAAIKVVLGRKQLSEGPLGKLIQDVVAVIDEGVRTGKLPTPSSSKAFQDACIKENARAKAMQVQEEFAQDRHKVIPAYYRMCTGDVGKVYPLQI